MNVFVVAVALVGVVGCQNMTLKKDVGWVVPSEDALLSWEIFSGSRWSNEALSVWGRRLNSLIKMMVREGRLKVRLMNGLVGIKVPEDEQTNPCYEYEANKNWVPSTLGAKNGSTVILLVDFLPEIKVKTPSCRQGISLCGDYEILANKSFTYEDEDQTWYTVKGKLCKCGMLTDAAIGVARLPVDAERKEGTGRKLLIAFWLIFLLVLVIVAACTAVSVSGVALAKTVEVAEEARTDISSVWKFNEAHMRDQLDVDLSEYCNIKQLTCSPDRLDSFIESNQHLKDIGNSLDFIKPFREFIMNVVSFFRSLGPLAFLLVIGLVLLILSPRIYRLIRRCINQRRRRSVNVTQL